MRVALSIHNFYFTPGQLRDHPLRKKSTLADILTGFKLPVIIIKVK